MAITLDGTNGITASGSGLSLGDATDNFQDLYLSGGVYLGGTGSANKLDDVETGTFTPFFRTSVSSTDIGSSYSFQLGRYVKTGNLVFFEIDMSANIGSTSGNIAAFGGLPFTSSTTSLAYPVSHRNCTCLGVPSGSRLNPFVAQNANWIFMQSETLTGHVSSNISSFNGIGRANLSGFYRVD